MKGQTFSSHIFINQEEPMLIRGERGVILFLGKPTSLENGKVITS